MKCVGIIWNCALNCKDEIFTLLNANATVISTTNLDLGVSFDTFVHDMYPFGSIAQWKINEKIKHMRSSSNSTKIIVVLFDIDVNDKFYHPYKKTYVYAKLELLKTWIRRISSEKISDYFYDISFHCTDNEQEFNYTIDTIHKYLSEVS